MFVQQFNNLGKRLRRSRFHGVKGHATKRVVDDNQRQIR